MLGQREQMQLMQPWHLQQLVHSMTTAPLDVKENHNVVVLSVDAPGVTSAEIKVRDAAGGASNCAARLLRQSAC